MRKPAIAGPITQAASLQSSGIARIGSAPAEIGEGGAEIVSDAASRFDLGVEIARGGMGRIVRAWDARHGRDVAIKLLLNRSPAMAHRFAREARITARLEHPAIVPVYESGHAASGEPFYAMKLVEGRSLAAAVAACASLDERLSLLPHLVAITDAIAYAHARGVIHRDLKPANVLLGAFGETVIIDWGLAKELGAPGDDAGPDEAGLEEAGEAGAADTRLTLAGRAIGTPCYMPPEQAAGEGADERSDVYALGALLYHLVAGAPPYPGGASDEVLARVKAGPPARIETIEPNVPPELATILAKAMARAPGDRYEAAASMSADLKRFGAGQRVSVHSYSLAALASRWAARHRAPLGVAAVLLVALAGVAGFSVRRVVNERDRADAANVVAEHDRAAMATQRDAAEKLVAFVITSLRDRLEQVGRLDVLAGVGEQVDDYYGSVAPLGKGAEPGVLARRAEALETLAGVEDAKQEPDAARRLYDEAEALRVEQAARAGDPAPAQASLGTLLVRRARFEMSQKSPATARPPAERAATMADALAARGPRDPAALALVAEAHTALASVAQREAHADVAAAEAAKGVDAARRLIAATGETPGALRALGGALEEAADVERGAGRFDSKSVDDAVDVRERLVAATPDDARGRLALARAYEVRAFCRREIGRVAEALADAERSKELRAALAARDPENGEWQRILGQAYDTLCSTQQLGKHPTDAIESCRASVAILERIAAKTPDAPSVHDNLLLAYQRLGWVYQRNGRLREATSAFESSLPIAERFAAGANGEHFVYRLADAHALLGDAAYLQKDFRTAKGHLAQTIALLEPLAAKSESFEAARTVIFAQIELGDIDERLGDRAEAKREMASAIERFVGVTLDASEEGPMTIIAETCAHVVPTEDPAVREAVRRAIELLEPVRVEGADPAPRLAFLARAKKALGP